MKWPGTLRIVSMAPSSPGTTSASTWVFCGQSMPASARVRAEAVAEVAKQMQQREVLTHEYASARALYDRLRAEIALVEEDVEAISVGLYKPHYHYDRPRPRRAVAGKGDAPSWVMKPQRRRRPWKRASPRNASHFGSTST